MLVGKLNFTPLAVRYLASRSFHISVPFQTNTLTHIKTAGDNTVFLDNLLVSANSLLSKNEETLSKSEEYLKQYGYTPPGLCFLNA